MEGIDRMPETHNLLVGYLFWILGFLGSHRFYYGRRLSGILYFFTGGLFLIGWIVDLFLMSSLNDDANRDYRPGPYDYNVAWLLHVFLGPLGIHRFYLGQWISGVVYLLTGGILGLGYIYDWLTLNDLVDELNGQAMTGTPLKGAA
jgi:TM2 domain-containing membrane protein YozV